MKEEKRMQEAIRTAYALLADWHASALAERPDLHHYGSLERNEAGQWWASARSYNTSMPPDAVWRRAAGLGSTPTEAARDAIANWKRFPYATGKGGQ